MLKSSMRSHVPFLAYACSALNFVANTQKKTFQAFKIFEIEFFYGKCVCVRMCEGCVKFNQFDMDMLFMPPLTINLFKLMMLHIIWTERRKKSKSHPWCIVFSVAN